MSVFFSQLYILNELNDLRKQFKSNKFKVFYFSKGLNNLQLFVEFLFEILHEKDEPLIMLIEAAKSCFKLREYYQLIHQEGINIYLDIESYRELTLLKEIKEGHIQMMKTKRLV